MRALIRAFKKANNVENNAVYVFLVNLPCSDASLMGFMPFSKQYGFVFVPTTGTDAATLSRTIAHEVAHGTFNLRHTFSPENPYTLPQGTTDNLMDYPSTSSGQATALAKYQWDLIHNPQNIWFAWLKEEEEGAMVNIVSLIQEIRNANVRGDNLLKIIRDKCPKIAYENIKLGNITLSYIHIACSELFEDEIPFESGKFQEFNWTNINNKEAIYIDPSEINKVITFGKKDNKKYVRFQFHELEEPKNNYIETFKKTNNLLFHFVVLEEEADLFESYLYALKDKLITIDLLKISDAGIKNLVSHEGKVSHVYNDAKGAKSYYCEEHKGHENIPEGKYKCSEKEHKNSKGDIGNPTIGVGHLIVGENELQKFCEKGTITDNEIEKLLKEDIVDKAEEPLKKAINECMKDAKLNQCQFDALLSIVFNRGIGCETCNNYPNGVGFKSSDLWKNYIKNGIFDSDDPDEKIEIKKKIINDGSILAGSKRRQDEAELYFNCKYKSK